MTLSEGSSPLPRGLPFGRDILHSSAGGPPAGLWPWPVPVFLPVLAVSTRCRGTENTAVSVVHPRVCGVLQGNTGLPVTVLGSSPRLRGSHTLGGAVPEVLGFIPASAGFAPRPGKKRRYHKVHPRVCGVRSMATTHLVSPGGSSPRLRGSPFGRDILYRQSCIRSIPARRGLPALPRGLPALVRFIPAAAGSALQRVLDSWATRANPRDCGSAVISRNLRLINMVHPCACWVRQECASSIAGITVSSPLVRGLPAEAVSDMVNEGFIPAGAGSACYGMRVP